MLFSIVKITLFLQSDDSKVLELLLSYNKQGIKNTHIIFQRYACFHYVDTVSNPYRLESIKPYIFKSFSLNDSQVNEFISKTSKISLYHSVHKLRAYPSVDGMPSVLLVYNNIFCFITIRCDRSITC